MTISTTPFPNIDNPATHVTTRRFAVVACVLWLGVAASPVTWWHTTDDWEVWYLIYSLLLSSAAAVTAGAAIRLAWTGSCGRVARLGAALTVIAVCSTLIAWALPIWMLSIAIGYGVFAIGAPEHRRALGFLALAQLVGLALLLAGEAVGVGPSDEYGDHPVAGSAGLTTSALLTAGAVVLLARQDRRPASTG